MKTDEARWRRVAALHADGTPETLEQALTACHSLDARHREVGADVLGQLGYAENKPFWKQSVPALLALLAAEEHPRVVSSAVHALGHLAWEHRGHMRSVVPRLTRLAEHADADVRHAVACALPQIRSHQAGRAHTGHSDP